MESLKLEKSIKKLDREIDALRVASKYLSNKEEIEEVRKSLNSKRQTLADELYYNDNKNYLECCEFMRKLLDRELDKAEQKGLLDKIRETFGRTYPNVSKEANGLNAWLRELDIEYVWNDESEGDWATLTITGFASHNM